MLPDWHTERIGLDAYSWLPSPETRRLNLPNRTPIDFESWLESPPAPKTDRDRKPRYLPNPLTVAKNLPGALWETAKFLGGLATPQFLWTPLALLAPPKRGFEPFTDEQRQIGGLIGDLFGLASRETPARTGTSLAMQLKSGLRQEQTLIGDIQRAAARRRGRTVPEPDPSQRTPTPYPYFQAYAEEIVESSPFGKRGWTGFVEHLEEEPDWVIDILLSTTGLGFGISGARHAARAGRAFSHATQRRLQPIPQGFLDDIDVLRNQATLQRQIADSHVDITALGRRRLHRLGRREILQVGKGVHIGGGEVATASHVVTGAIGTADAPGALDIRRIVLRTAEGQRRDAQGVSGIRPEADLAILDVPQIQSPALHLEHIQDPRITLPRLTETRTTAATRTAVPSAEIGRTQLTGQPGMSGAGFETETGEFGLYIGVAGDEGLFATRQTLLSFQRSQRQTLGFGELDTVQAVQALATRGLHYQHARFRHIGMRQTPGSRSTISVGLHSGSHARGGENESLFDYFQRLSGPDTYFRAAHPSEDTLNWKSFHMEETQALNKHLYLASIPDDLRKALNIDPEAYAAPFALGSGSFIGEPYTSQLSHKTYDPAVYTKGIFATRTLRDQLYNPYYLNDRGGIGREGGSELRVVSGTEIRGAHYLADYETLIKPTSVLARFNAKKLYDLYFHKGAQGFRETPAGELRLDAGPRTGIPHLREFLEAADRHPNIFYRIAAPDELPTHHAMDLWQTLTLTTDQGSTLPLPDSYIAEGLGRYGGIKRERQHTQWSPVYAGDRDLDPDRYQVGHVRRRGLYGHRDHTSMIDTTPEINAFRRSEIPLDAASLSSERRQGRATTLLDFNEPRQLMIHFGTETPYQEYLAPTENVFLSHGVLDVLPTNIADSRRYTVNAMFDEFIETAHTDFSSLIQTLERLPTETDPTEIWQRHLTGQPDPIALAFEAAQRRHFMTEGLRLHSGHAEWTRGWPHRVSTPRYATEHILSPDFFEDALDRGYLSGEKGRYGGLLYFSEGPHYRGRMAEENTHHGFLFDPNDLEYTFGAVPTFMRYHRVLSEAAADPELKGRKLLEKFLYPDPQTPYPASEQTFYNMSYGKERPYFKNVLETMRSEQFGLEALLKFQRKYDVNVEPEFVIPFKVPLARAIGVTDPTGAYWIHPNTRGNDFNRWELEAAAPEDFGGREPGSFSHEGIHALIIPDALKLHSGRKRKRYGEQTLFHATTPENVESILKTGLDPTRSRGKRKHVYLFTPSREAWARDHITKKYGIEREAVPIFEVLADRSQLTRRWRGIWSTPEHITPDKLKLRLDAGDLRHIGTDFAFSTPRWGHADRLERWAFEQSLERPWGRYLQNATDIATNAAVISTAAQTAVQAVQFAAGHEIEPTAFLRAGAEIGAAFGIHRANQKLGTRGLLPEDVVFDPSFEARVIKMSGTVPADAGEHLHRIFSQAGASQNRPWRKGSLARALERYDDNALATMFGAEGAEYITRHAHLSRQFGQRSHQTKRDWGQTILGLLSGDFGDTTRYIYNPETRHVTPTPNTHWSIDTLLERYGDRHFLLSAWRERRTEIHYGERTDWLAKIGLPLQERDVQPHIGYMLLPEARGIGRFFNRYIADTPEEKQWTKSWTLENIARGIGDADALGNPRWANRFAETLGRRKQFRKESNAVLERRRTTAALYPHQDPDHLYEVMADTLGIDTQGFQGFGRQMLGSPYSRFGRFGANIPKTAKVPLIAAGTAAGGYLAYKTFFGDDDDTLTLEDPAGYSLSPRFPILGMIQRTTPYRRLRARAENLLDDIYDPGTYHAEMLKSIVLGKKGNLPQDVKETFVETGQIHALVQSGMHINVFRGLLSRYPFLGIPAAVSTLKDTLMPPKNEVVKAASQDFWDKYKPSRDPWIPRLNPERPSSGEIKHLQQLGQLPEDYEVDFSKPWWAYWDPKKNYDIREDAIRRRKGSRVIPGGGYLYSIQNAWSGKRYIGLSTASADSRIHKHLTGKGSKAIAAELITGFQGGEYTHEDFITHQFHLPGATYYQLGEWERKLIADFDTQNTGYNQSAGGEIRDPLYEYKPRTQPFVQSKARPQDIVPWATYAMFGVLPEAPFPHLKQGQQKEKMEGIKEVATPITPLPGHSGAEEWHKLPLVPADKRKTQRQSETPQPLQNPNGNLPFAQPTTTPIQVENAPNTREQIDGFSQGYDPKKDITIRPADALPEGSISERDRLLLLLTESDNDTVISDLVDRVLEELEIRKRSQYIDN